MVLLYMLTWIPSIYPSHVSIYISTTDPMGVWSSDSDWKWPAVVDEFLPGLVNVYRKSYWKCPIFIVDLPIKNCDLTINNGPVEIVDLPWEEWGFSIVGWWFPPTPLKNDGVSNSWDDDSPTIWKNKIHVPNHQPVALVFCLATISIKPTTWRIEPFISA